MLPVDESTPLIKTGLKNTSYQGCIATRHILVILGFFGFFNVYMMRVNLSVAIVAMVADTTQYNDTISNGTVIQGECIGTSNVTKQHKSTANTYPWDEKVQNQILSAFFYGYIVTQLPGGWLAGKFGGKWIFGFGILSTSVLTLLSEAAASAGVGWFITLRVLEGLGEGVTYPAMFAIMAQWAPPYERTKMTTITVSGAILGTVVANPMAGILCDSDFLGGWPSVFYLSGTLGVIWFILWAMLIHDTPAKHPRISLEERKYIETSIGSRNKGAYNIPILSIITSVPVWAIVIAQFCSSFGKYTLLTNLPNYLKNILKFDITQSGFLASLPYLSEWTFIIITGIVADFLRENGYLTTTRTRKLFNGLGALIPAIALPMVGFVGCNQTLAVLFFCVGNIGHGIVQSGHSVNSLDIAPKYASLIYGIANTIGTSSGIFAPTVIGALTQGNNTREQWQIIFWICCGFYSFAFITYTLMGSGEEQPWARDAAAAYETIVSESIDNGTAGSYVSDDQTLHHVSPSHTKSSLKIR